MLLNPQYSPDTAPADYFMYLKLKRALKEIRFHSVEEIKARVTVVLKTIPKEEFLASFQHVYKRSKSCTEREEKCSYVEN